MKSTHVRLSLLAAALAGAAAIPATAAAEVSASAGVANVYLWRGFNLSGGAPVVYGGLEYATEPGAYAGIWGSASGGYGQEVDLYAGFRGGDEFTYNIAYYDYTYPAADTTGMASAGSRMNDYEEVIVNLGAAGFTLDVALGVGDSGGVIINNDGENKTETRYVALGYTYEKFTAKYGMWDGWSEDPDLDGDANPKTGSLVDANFSHLDVSYKYNDNLSFTISKVVDDDDKIEDDTQFQVCYLLPLDLKAAK